MQYPDWNCTTCYNGGECVPDRDLCSCPLYYNPLTECKQTIYETHYTEFLTYNIIAKFITFGIMGAYMYEIVHDFVSLKSKWRSPILYIKAQIILYCIVKLISISLDLIGLQENNTDYAFASSIMQGVAVSLYGMSYMLSSMYFFTLLLKAKNFGGIQQRELVAFKYIIIGLISIFIPAILILMTLGLYGIGMPDVKNASDTMLIVMLASVFLIMFVYIIRTFVWFHKEKDMFKSSKRLQRLRRKTIIITLITFWLIAISLIIPGTRSLPADLPDVILFRSYVTEFNEASTFIFMWFFLENSISTRRKDLSSSGVTPV